MSYNPKSVKTSNDNLYQFIEVVDSNLKPVNSTEGTVIPQEATTTFDCEL